MAKIALAILFAIAALAVGCTTTQLQAGPGGPVSLNPDLPPPRDPEIDPRSP